MCLGYNIEAIRYELPYSVKQHSSNWFGSLREVSAALIALNELAPVAIYDSESPDIAAKEPEWFVELILKDSLPDRYPVEKRMFRIAVADVNDFNSLMSALSYSGIKVKQGDLFVFDVEINYFDLDSMRLTKTASALPVYTYVEV